MCIAIYKPANIVINKETLHRCFLKNKDGCGFAYFKSDGELIIEKSMSFDKFYEDYEFHSVINSDRPFLIHFRIATHGTVDLFNCHPFQVDNNHVMIHNGIIHNIRKCPDKLRSDTQMFVDDVLKELPSNWMHNTGITNLIEDYIGASKVVVLAADDEVTIYNEHKGEWADDVWYSNSGYKEYKPITHYSWSKDTDYYAGRYGEARKSSLHKIWNKEKGILEEKFGKYEYQKDGGYAFVEDVQDTTVLEWKYNKSLGVMEEWKNGVYTGFCYKPSQQVKEHEERGAYLALVPTPKDTKANDYDSCCSCVKSFFTDELFIVEDFGADDCYLCQDCIDEYKSIGMAMQTPRKLSDVKAELDFIFDEASYGN